MQSLLTIFVESSLGDKRQDTQTAVKFLDDQIKNYEQNLQAAENRIKDFKLKYMGLSSQSQGQDYFGRVATLGNAIEAARVELQSAEQARDSYKKELAGEEPVFLPEPTESRTREAVPEIDSRLDALKRELDSAAAQVHGSASGRRGDAAADRAARGAAHRRARRAQEGAASRAAEGRRRSTRIRCSSR